MNDPLTVMNSTGFIRIAQSMSLVALFLGIAAALVAMLWYGRTRDVYGATAEKQRWTLLMGTWRDSLIITVLFVSESLVYQFGAFQAMTLITPSSILLYAPVVQAVVSTCVAVLIFAIAILRIITISRWLAAQKESAG